MEQAVKKQAGETQSALMNLIIRISRIMAAVGAVSLFGMMAVTVIDVGGRELFLKPLNGAFEIIGILLLIAGTWGMGYCEMLKMNIRIGLVTDRFPERVKALLWILTFIISGAMAVMIAWRSFIKTEDLFTAKLGNRTDTLGIPLWPFTAMMALGFLWAGFIFLVEFFQGIIGVFRK